MTVAQVCRREVDLVDPDESAWAAAERMLQRSVGSLLVLDQRRRPIGVVTCHDLVVKVMASEKSPRTTRVRDIMTAPAQTVLHTASVSWAISVMCADDLRCLAVVDGHGRLVGILSMSDALRYLVDEDPQVRDSLGWKTSAGRASSDF